MKRLLQDRSFRLSIVLTLLFFSAGVAFLLLGLADYSWILFILLPVVLGLSIGALPNKRWVLLGAAVATVAFLCGLLMLGWSGFICAIMTLPLVLPVLFLGSVASHLARRYAALKPTSKLPVLLLPLLVFLLAAPTERQLRTDKKQVVAVRTAQVYHYSPEQVYEAIKAVDTLVADKPFLMYFDLPVPTKCVLEKEAVGGLRTCYFSGGNLSNGDFGGGRIVEKITQLEKAKVLRMDVIDYNLIGRKWLGFKEAIYYFDQAGAHGCRLTRITTYTSELTPRAYWEPLEKLGIRQEHDYVFRNLSNDLTRKYPRAGGPVTQADAALLPR